MHTLVIPDAVCTYSTYDGGGGWRVRRKPGPTCEWYYVETLHRTRDRPTHAGGLAVFMVGLVVAACMFMYPCTFHTQHRRPGPSTCLRRLGICRVDTSPKIPVEIAVPPCVSFLGIVRSIPHSSQAQEGGHCAAIEFSHSRVNSRRHSL